LRALVVLLVARGQHRESQDEAYKYIMTGMHFKSTSLVTIYIWKGRNAVRRILKTKHVNYLK